MENIQRKYPEIKASIEEATAKLNELLKVANDLLIPVAVKPDNTTSPSGNDVAVTKKLLTIVYPAKI
jgi:hypothetical protein